jgi:hypothetical protein
MRMWWRRFIGEGEVEKSRLRRRIQWKKWEATF